MTSTSPTPPGSEAVSEAESLFYGIVDRTPSGGLPDIEVLCAARPDLADELRSLCERHRGAREVLGVVAVPGADEPEPDDPPARPGRYEIRGEIARGGIGSILEVWDAELQRTLAMKVVRRDQLEENVLGRVHYERRQSRLLNEAQILGQLDHPGIVPVHEVGRNERGELYFAMQRVRGRDLSEIIDCVAREEEGWTLPRAVGVVLRVCEAMAHAHSKGVIHRDLKPGNVMVGRFGETYVIDWGLAKAVGSPEAANIRLREVAVSAPPDGEGSSEGEAPSVVRTHRQADSDSDPASPLWTMEGDVIGTPAYMSPEQARGRIEEVDERSDVYGAGALLYHLLSGKRPYSTSGSRRSPQEVLGMVLHGPPDPLRSAAPGAPDELVAIGEKAMARDPERRYAGMEEMAEDLRAWLEGRVVHVWHTSTWQELATLVGPEDWVGGAAFSLDGRWLCTASSDAKVRLWDLDRAGREHQTSIGRGIVRSLAFHPEGELIACALGEGKVVIWDVARRRAVRTFFIGGHRTTVAFSPDGQRMATGRDDGRLRLWDAETGELLRTLEGHHGLINHLAFHPDGIRIATGGMDHTLRLWDGVRGEELWAIEANLGRRGWPEGVLHLVFSPDGESIATCGYESCLRLWHTQDGEPRQVLSGESARYGQVCFSPDGKRIGGRGADPRCFQTWEVESGTCLWIDNSGRRPAGPRFSADGERLFC